MSLSISSLDLYFILKELGDLSGARIDNIYHPDKEEILLQLYQSSKGKKIIKIIVGNALFETKHKQPQEEPSQFCMLLRKYLGNKKIKNFSQVESQRVVNIEFENKVNLTIEFFDGGNIILTNEESIIITALKQRTFKDRIIKPKQTYSLPTSSIDLFKASKKDLITSLDKSKDNLTKSIATIWGTGGKFAKEIVGDSDDPKKAADTIKELLRKKVDPHIVKKDDKITQILPFKFVSVKGQESAKSLSESYDQSYLAAQPVVKSKAQKEKERLERIIEKQSNTIESINKKEKDLKTRGDKIYENFQLIDEIIKEINKAKKSHTWDSIKSKLKGHKIIKSLNSKEKSIEIEI